MKNQRRTSLVFEGNGAIYTSLMLIVMSLFYLVTLPLLRQPLPLHELAKLKTNGPALVPLVISIKKNAAYYINTTMQTTEAMSLAKLKESLNKQLKIMDPQQLSLCIKADPCVTYSEVANLVDWLQTLGIQHVGLLTTDAI